MIRFDLVRLGNFNLLLFSFNQGPLSSSQPSLPFLHFISIALHSSNPKINKNSPLEKSPRDAKNGVDSPSPSPDFDSGQLQYFKKFLIAAKVVLLVVIACLYRYRQYLHPGVIMALYCCHLYLGIELVLAITAVPVRAILGLDLERQFNEPYLATSLQDFWGRRWNLMVTSILRPTVYNPIRSVSAHVLGPKWSLYPAILGTFCVSGIVHEVFYYYLTRDSPTWEVTWFFVLHGICVACEIAVKKALHGRWLASGPLTIGFLAVTGAWLFFPQIVRNGTVEKAIHEYSILARFIRESVRLPSAS